MKEGRHAGAKKTIKPLFIGGEWVETSELHPIYNKYTGELFAQVSKAGEAEKNAALEAAERAFWQSDFAPAQRFQVLMKMYHLLLDHLEEFAEAIAAEGGKPIVDARTEVNRSALIFLLSAEEAIKITGEMIPAQVAPNLNIGKRLIYTIKKTDRPCLCDNAFQLSLKSGCPQGRSGLGGRQSRHH